MSLKTHLHHWRVPKLSADDLTEEGWERKTVELEAAGIDPATYLGRHVVRTVRTDPELNEALKRVRARQPLQQRLRREFFNWGYRATLTGFLAVAIIGSARILGLNKKAPAVFFTFGAIAIVAVAGLTCYALVLLVHYLRVREQSGDQTSRH